MRATQANVISVWVLGLAVIGCPSADDVSTDEVGDTSTTESETSGESTSDESTSGESTSDESTESTESSSGSTESPESTSDESTESTGEAFCGDGIVNAGEDCDDANTSELDGCTTQCVASETPVLQLVVSPIKQFEFAWAPVLGAEHYQLLESVDVDEPFVPIGENLVATSTTLTVPLHFRASASYVLRACDGQGCVESEPVDVVGSLAEGVGYIKASNTDPSDELGQSIAISTDGNTLAIGSNNERSSATGIDGDQSDDSAPAAGAVYIFVRDGNEWSQQAYVKASNTDPNDAFGSKVALSADGNTLVVGAPTEDSSATGIDGDQADDSASAAGAVYVFARSGDAWSQQAYVKASNAAANDRFGGAITLSSDGDTMAVGAIGEDSSAMGIDGNQADDSMTLAGAVYVFARNGDAWSQQAYVKASNPGMGDDFGASVALSGDGNTLAVGAFLEDGSAAGIDGNQADNATPGAGAVYVFARSGNTWSQQAYVKASNPDVNDAFGANVALSGDGDTLAVAAIYESSNAIGIDGNQADDSSNQAGAVYVFVRSGDAWSQQAYVKASNTGSTDHFGWSLALSSTGGVLAIGAHGEDGGSAGIGGNEVDESASDAGAVYVFVRSVEAWSQRAYVKAPNVDAGDEFSRTALSGDGQTLVVGAVFEDGSSVGVGGDQADDAMLDAGAVYIY